MPGAGHDEPAGFARSLSGELGEHAFLLREPADGARRGLWAAPRARRPRAGSAATPVGITRTSRAPRARPARPPPAPATPRRPPPRDCRGSGRASSRETEALARDPCRGHWSTSGLPRVAATAPAPSQCAGTRSAWRVARRAARRNEASSDGTNRARHGLWRATCSGRNAWRPGEAVVAEVRPARRRARPRLARGRRRPSRR